MCGKEFRKYVESTAINIFFVYFPMKYTIFFWGGVRGGDGNPFDPNVFQDKYRECLCDIVVLSTIGLCGETLQATWIAKWPQNSVGSSAKARE